MKRTLSFAKAALLALCLAAFGASVTHTRTEYTRKEKTACITCHTRAGTKELNAVGKCYGEKQSLKDCQPKEKK